MPKVATIGSPVACGDSIAEGSSDVFIGGMPVALIGDKTTGHGCFPPSVIIEGSGTVSINNKAVARVGHKIRTHCCNGSCHDSEISDGVATVFVD